MYSLDLWTNCHAALHMMHTFGFSSYFCVPTAYALYAEVCDLQIFLFCHQQYFYLQHSIKLHSPFD